MAIRNLRLEGDPILRKKSREVKEVTPKIRELIDDMLETMYDKDGVGLAAPQVGILRRIVVIDVGDGPLVMVNPQIIREEGSQTGDEGCLSVPGKAGQVTRPNEVMSVLWTKKENTTNWTARSFWRGPSATSASIWTENSTLIL